MPHDFSQLASFLEDHKPKSIVRDLDSNLYNIILAAEYLETTNGLADQYINLL